MSAKVTLSRSGVGTSGCSTKVPRRRRGLFWVCVAAVLALGGSTAQAGSVLFAFHGNISSLESTAVGLTSFKVGDAFTLVLDYTPGGPSPCYGFYLGAGSAFVNPESLSSISGTSGAAFWDTDFKSATEYQMYCRSDISLTDSVLCFLMQDEGIGPSGSVTVGATFPKEWMSDMSDPLPGGAFCVHFTATGQMDFDLAGLSETEMFGDITCGEVYARPVPLPPAFLPGLLGMAGLLFYRRHCLKR
jgi:hypothetical protein